MSAISGMLDPVADQLGGLDVLLLGDGDADDLAARLFQAEDLRQRLLDVEGVGRGHRLHPDRVVAADDVIANSPLRASCAARPSSHTPSIRVLVSRWINQLRPFHLRRSHESIVIKEAAVGQGEATYGGRVRFSYSAPCWPRRTASILEGTTRIPADDRDNECVANAVRFEGRASRET